MCICWSQYLQWWTFLQTQYFGLKVKTRYWQSDRFLLCSCLQNYFIGFWNSLSYLGSFRRFDQARPHSDCHIKKGNFLLFENHHHKCSQKFDHLWSNYPYDVNLLLKYLYGLVEIHSHLFRPLSYQVQKIEENCLGCRLVPYAQWISF